MSEQQYLNLLDNTLCNGALKDDRTGVGVRSLFGRQLGFDLSRGYPLLTTKRVFFRGVVEELFWMARGETNVSSLQEQGVYIWDAWADKSGDLGPVYGAQWRAWVPSGDIEIDQLALLLHGLRTDPHGRRHVMTAWNPGELDEMALPPCHLLVQFYVAHGKLSCQVYQRSADLFLGVPFNIASYALLTHLVARHVNLNVGYLSWVGGDCHIYENHTEQVQEQLTREPTGFPQLEWVTPARNLFQVIGLTQASAVSLQGYDPHPAIKAPIAV